MIRSINSIVWCVILCLCLFCGVSEGTTIYPYSGSYAWHSGQGNNLTNTLYQDFDTSILGDVTLQFTSWHETQSPQDYGVIEVSTDGGATYTILQTLFGSSSAWDHYSFDISSWKSTSTRIRFRYETDSSIIRTGWMIDNIEISSIGFFDDVETGNNGWVTGGWAITDHLNVIPEPSPMLLMGMGLLFIASIRRRQK